MNHPNILHLKCFLWKHLCLLVLSFGVLISPASADDDDEVAIEDYKQAIKDLGEAAFGLSKEALVLRLRAGVDLERGNQLSGTAELADSVRLLMQEGIRYVQNPGDLYEVFDSVLIQLRYLNEHTAATFDEEAYWDRINDRLDALGEPSYALARVLIDTYLPAVRHANEIAQAEATLQHAVQALFDTFLLQFDDEEEEDSESDEEDSESEDDESDSDEYESEDSESEEGEEDSDEYSSESEASSSEEEDSSSDGYTSSEEEEEYSEPEEPESDGGLSYSDCYLYDDDEGDKSENDSVSSGYETDTDTSYGSFMLDVVSEGEDDLMMMLEVGDPFAPSVEMLLRAEDLDAKYLPRERRGLFLPHISSSSTWSWF